MDSVAGIEARVSRIKYHENTSKPLLDAVLPRALGILYAAIPALGGGHNFQGSLEMQPVTCVHRKFLSL